MEESVTVNKNKTEPKRQFNSLIIFILTLSQIFQLQNQVKLRNKFSILENQINSVQTESVQYSRTRRSVCDCEKGDIGPPGKFVYINE